MSSIPNMFNLYGDDDTNHHHHHGFVPIQTNHTSNMVRSMFITSDQTNNGDLFSLSPSFTCYQNTHVSSSSSFGFNSSLMNHQMRRNIDSGFVMPCREISSVTNCFPLQDNPHLTQISITQTITNRYCAIVPTNTISNFQNDFERFNRVMDYRTNILNSTIHPPNFLENQSKILNPKPLNVLYPHQNSSYHQNQNHVSHQDGLFFKKSPKPTNYFQENFENYFDSEEDDDDDECEDGRYDGRTHSLPYEKYGPYTCPKCGGVFDTSQKFAAHMSHHYKNETNKERVRRFRARNKRKYRKLNHQFHQEPQKIKLENGGGIIDVEAFQYPVIVKEEPF